MEPHDGLHTVNRDNNILLRSPTAPLALYTTTPVRTFSAGKSRHMSWFPGRIAQTYNHAGIESDFMDSSGSYHYQHSLAGWLAGTDGRGQLGDLQDCEDQ